MESINTRTALMLNEEQLNSLRSARVAVIGLGGVGGIAAETLVRSGVNEIIIVDNDVVSTSNLNRQILYTSKDIGHKKVECAKARFLDINEEIKVIPIDAFLDESNIEKIFSNIEVDYVIDAIDSLYSKLAIAKYCIAHNIPYIISLGMGGRLDSTKVEITTLDKTVNCPFAKKFRLMLRKEKINLKKVVCAFTIEEIRVRNKDVVPSMMMVPNAAGLALGGYVVQRLIGGK